MNNLKLLWIAFFLFSFPSQDIIVDIEIEDGSESITGYLYNNYEERCVAILLLPSEYPKTRVIIDPGHRIFIDIHKEEPSTRKNESCEQ